MNDENEDSRVGSAQTAAAAGGAAQPIFRMENILVKNVSLETPSKTPSSSPGQKAGMKLELRTSSRRLARENYYEVSLEANCRLLSGEETQILVEVAQSGVVLVENADAALRDRILNIHAAEMLYPYICQFVGDLLARAGAPRLFLPPFNFRALYERKLREAKQKNGEEKSNGAAAAVKVS